MAPEPTVDVSACCEIWTVDLRTPASADMARVLSGDERERADAFVFDLDRSRWIRARSALRHVLSDLVNLPPEAIAFDYASFGKPQLTQSSEQAKVWFNLSHAGDLALIAIDRIGEIGIDIEQFPNPRLDFLEIAPLVLSQAERRQLAGFDDDFETVLCRIWTCKEAYVKALGVGLSVPLADIETDIAQSGIPVVRSSQHEDDASRIWTSCPLVLERGYVGTLVHRGQPDRPVRYRRFPK